MVKYFRRGLLGKRAPQPAVDGADLTVPRGRRLGLIGESGSGKTTLARAALGLLPFDQGEVDLMGQRLQDLDPAALRKMRRRVQLLFQNPDAHLNPGLRVRQILEESARVHRSGSSPVELAREALAKVGLDQRIAAWPHQLSGGEKRRVGIARVLVADPDLIVADEPTAGLDAGLKAELMDLLVAQGGRARALLLISHDLPLVAFACEEIAVMYGGRIVEQFPSLLLSHGPHHPYTWALLSAAGLGPEQPPIEQPGAGPGASGCGYLGACPIAGPACAQLRPAPYEINGAHRIACHMIEVA